MNALVKKELRLLLPAWGMALLCVVIAAPLAMTISPNTAEPGPLIVLCFAAAGLFLGLASFGQELSCGTVVGLFTQPVSRGRLLVIKLSVLAVAVLTLMATLPVFHAILEEPFRRNAAEAGADGWVSIFVLSLMVTLSGGLWSTLLCRQVSTAFWVTLLAPLGLILGVLWLT